MEVLVGTAIIMVCAVVAAFIGELFTRWVDGFGCLDFWEALISGLGLIVVVAIFGAVAWAIGMVVL